MWHVLRAELAYYRPYLFGGLGLAAGVSILVSVVFQLAKSDAPSHALPGIRGMFLIMAPMIVGFIAQGLRSEERRERLLLSGPLTPRQIATVMVLMTVVLCGIGVLTAGLVLGGAGLITGRLEVESLHMVVYVGGLLFAMLQMVPLAQEAAAARGQRRTRAALAGWASFVLAVLFFALLSVAAFVLQGSWTWFSLHLGNLIVALTAMIATVTLYAGRTDFTR